MLRTTLFALLLGLSAVTNARAAAAEVTVEVGDFFFCSASQAVGTCETVITAGDTVRWAYTQGTEGHTVTHCGDSCATPTGAPLFDSGSLNTGETFAFTFDTPGRYLYYCVFHPPFMQAAVVVEAAQATPTPAPAAEPATPTVAPTEEPAPTPTATPRASPAPARSPTEAPATSVEEDDDGGDTTLWLVVVVVVVMALAATAGTFVVWRRRTG
jgi:plastocyanin